MIAFWHIEGSLHRIEQQAKGCWIQVTKPDSNDIHYLVDSIGIPDGFLSDISDNDERPRYDFDDGWAMIILRVPYANLDNSRTPYNTVPLGIVTRGDVFVTLCNFTPEMMPDFIAYQQKRGEGFTDFVDLIFRLFLSSAVWYLKYLKQIGSLVDRSKGGLTKSINNSDMIKLSRLQDSLTYFITSIKGNETLLARLKFKLPVDQLDVELIEDVNIEMSQAQEMTNIYSNILDSTMDTYANIINNNMSDVVKTLTSVSILLMFPTLISSFLGMNVPNGMETAWWAFPMILFGSIISTLIFLWYFRRKDWI